MNYNNNISYLEKPHYLARSLQDSSNDVAKKNLEKLLKRNPNLNQITEYGNMTPLMLLAGNPRAFETFLEVLNKPGIDINYHEPRGTRAIHEAVAHGNVKAVLELLKRPDIYLGSSPGFTTTPFTVFLHHSKYEYTPQDIEIVVRAFLDAGYQPTSEDIQNINEYLPEDAQKNTIAQLIESSVRGRNVNVASVSKKSVLESPLSKTIASFLTKASRSGAGPAVGGRRKTRKGKSKKAKKTLRKKH